MKQGGAVTILRWGLAFVFFYASIDALISPNDWIAFVPGFITGIISAHAFLTAFSFYQLALAVLLFSGRKLFWSSLLATITLAGIVVFEFSFIDVVFRDVGLLFAALALFEISRSSGQNFKDEQE